MAKISNPITFSKQFSINPEKLKKADLVDPFLNADTKLFIDPALLEFSANEEISLRADKAFSDRMQAVIDFVGLSKRKNDLSWKSASNLLDLSEASEICMGFGGSSASGSDRPQSVKDKILNTISEAIEIGLAKPDLIKFISIIEEGIGPDTISDLTTNLIKLNLAIITEKFCKENRIPTATFWVSSREFKLPRNPYSRQDGAVLLVPRDILRDLPIAADWSDVDRVMSLNQELKKRINEKLKKYTEATIVEKKRAFREEAFRVSSDFLKLMIDGLRGSAKPYDFDKDPLGFQALRNVLAGAAIDHPLALSVERKSASALNGVVKQIIFQFKKLVENGDLADLLWDDEGKAKREAAAQLLFYAIAQAYCNANNLDISPETDHGGGPVDFKFSQGIESRILVELKKSTANVSHGFEKQLEVYKDAASPYASHYVVLRVGGVKQFRNKMKAIEKIKNKMIEEGEKVSEIYGVDATRKPSATKRK